MWDRQPSTRRSIPRQARRDLVDDAVQVVDPSLQRDREVDEVVLARPEQDELGLPHGAKLQVAGQREEERYDCRRRGADGDPGAASERSDIGA